MTENLGFTTIALPKELVDKIDRFIEASEHMYTSRSHVVKVALFKFFKNNGGD